LVSFALSCLYIAGVLSSLLLVISWLLVAWLLCCSRMQYYYCNAHEEQHHEHEQSNKLTIKHKSHTIILFSVSQYYHCSRHDDLDDTTTSTLCAQRYMFSGALSFDQDLSSWDVSAGTDFVSDTGGGA